MYDVSGAYRGVRERVTEVVEQSETNAYDTPVPATPQWRLRDLLAHMVGVPADVIAGRLDGIATDAWTGAQVAARRDVGVDEMLKEWSEVGPQFETAIGAAPFEIAGQALFDAVTHEHDLRNALGASGGRDSDALEMAWAWIVDARTRGGAPALRYVADGIEAVSGSGDVQATIQAPRFELLRAVSGRRTTAEVAAYGWDPEPRPDLMLGAAMFTMRSTSLNE